MNRERSILFFLAPHHVQRPAKVGSGNEGDPS